MPDGWDDEVEHGETSPEELAMLERNGMFAIGAGILAMTCAMCTYPSYGLLGVPTIMMGLIALFLGRSVQASGVMGAPRAYANMAVTTGAISTLWAALVLLICGAIVALYMVIFAVIFGVAGSM